MKHPLKKLLWLLIVVTLLLPYRYSSAQSGVLIPSTSSKPDPNTLSLQVMNVDVLIDNQHARVKVMVKGKIMETTVGRIIFNESLPPGLEFLNKTLGKRDLEQLVGECYRRLGNIVTARFLDRLKNIGFLRQADFNRLKDDAAGQVTTLLELFGYSEDDIFPRGPDLPGTYMRAVLEMLKREIIDEQRAAQLLRMSQTKTRQLAQALPDLKPAADPGISSLLDEVEDEDLDDEPDEVESLSDREPVEA